MSEISIEQLIGEFSRAAKTIDVEIAKVVKRTALQVKETQRATVPVASGKTRDSIAASGPNGAPFTPVTLEAEIGPTWFVGRFLEEGTVNMAPHPFVSASYDSHATDHEKGIQDAMVFGALKGLA